MRSRNTDRPRGCPGPIPGVGDWLRSRRGRQQRKVGALREGVLGGVDGAGAGGVVTVTSTVPVPAEGATAVSTNDVPP